MNRPWIIAAAFSLLASCSASEALQPDAVARCGTASSCGSRQYCNAEQTCICVRSAEGVNRCGQIPTTCYMQLCTTSADCAPLGPGYFCDTPGSGCCTDPPASLSRCIAPCDTPDPGPADAGLDGPLEPDAPPEDAPPVDAPPEDAPPEDAGTAADAGPTMSAALRCAEDPPTAESMEAARAELAAGATSVRLSPGGCVALERTIVDGMLIHEELAAAGAVTLSSDYSGASAMTFVDADLDGFAEQRVELTSGATPDDDRLVIDTYASGSQAQVGRRTYTRTGDTLHVVVEEAGESGTLTEIARYDTSRFQPGRVCLTPVDALARVPGLFSSCSADDEALIRSALVRALLGPPGGGIQCLKDLGENAGVWNALNVAFAKGIAIECDESQAVIARYDTSSWFGRITSRSVSVNPSRFRGLTATEQERLLFHEALHEVAEHEYDFTDGSGTATPGEVDVTEACASVCFARSLATKCECAMCLRTSVCDPRCAKFLDCKRGTGRFICPCPRGRNAFKVFSSCSECLATCPSGLACAGYSTCGVLPDIGCPASPVAGTCP